MARFKDAVLRASACRHDEDDTNDDGVGQTLDLLLSWRRPQTPSSLSVHLICSMGAQCPSEHQCWHSETPIVWQRLHIMHNFM